MTILTFSDFINDSVVDLELGSSSISESESSLSVTLSEAAEVAPKPLVAVVSSRLLLCPVIVSVSDRLEDVA